MKNKLFISFCIFLLSCFSTVAQNHLEIKTVFDKYGKQEGSVLVQLSTDVLSQGSRMILYKSLITDYSPQKNKEIIDALNSDMKKGVKITEVKKDGVLESGTYYLKDQGSNKEYEYILYKDKSKKITIVYIKGNFPPQQLNDELKKLKDLFIYVNDKRIKLQ